MHHVIPIVKFFLIAALMCTLLCCSKISQKNYNKITTEMTLNEVASILGEPTTSEQINIGGIRGISAIWKDKNGEIDIQFLNDKVLVKSYSSAEQAN